MSTYHKYLPVVNFIVATTALTFQMTVLYPWHNQLDADFRDLERKHISTLEEYHKVKMQYLSRIEDTTKRLLEIQSRQQQADKTA